jgi:hypothetical protein
MQLETHHKHYRTLGNEEFDDVNVVCKACHIYLEEERAA